MVSPTLRRRSGAGVVASMVAILNGALGWNPREPARVVPNHAGSPYTRRRAPERALRGLGHGARGRARAVWRRHRGDTGDRPARVEGHGGDTHVRGRELDPPVARVDVHRAPAAGYRHRP